MEPPGPGPEAAATRGRRPGPAPRLKASARGPHGCVRPAVLSQERRSGGTAAAYLSVAGRSAEPWRCQAATPATEPPGDSGRVHWPDPVTPGRRRTRTARWPFVRPKPGARRRRSARWVILRCSEVPPSPRRSPGLSSAGPQAGPQRPSGPRRRGPLPPRSGLSVHPHPRALAGQGAGSGARSRGGQAGAAGSPPAPASPVRCEELLLKLPDWRVFPFFFSLLNWNVSCCLSVFITSQLAN